MTTATTDGDEGNDDSGNNNNNDDDYDKNENYVILMFELKLTNSQSTGED